MPKITIEDVRQERGHWEIPYTLTQDDGMEEKVLLVVAYDTLEWRAAEYNIPVTDLDTLVDIIVCEQFIEQEHFEGEKSLFKAATVDEAREEYLRKIAEIKLKYRVSTRGKSHPLQKLKNGVVFDPARVAIKGAAVILEREKTAGAPIDPHVKTVLKSIMGGLEQMMQRIPNKDQEKLEKAMNPHG